MHLKVWVGDHKLSHHLSSAAAGCCLEFLIYLILITCSLCVFFPPFFGESQRSGKQEGHRENLKKLKKQGGKGPEIQASLPQPYLHKRCCQCWVQEQLISARGGKKERCTSTKAIKMTRLRSAIYQVSSPVKDINGC